MTLYCNFPARHFPFRRHMLEHALGRAWSEVEQEVYFPMDVLAEDDAYVISALLPGLKAEDLSVEVVNDTVIIQGELKVKRDEKARYLLQERPGGRFSRKLVLPDVLDAEKAQADLSNGVLTLRIPKAEGSKPKNIKITSQ